MTDPGAMDATISSVINMGPLSGHQGAAENDIHLGDGILKGFTFFCQHVIGREEPPSPTASSAGTPVSTILAPRLLLLHGIGTNIRRIYHRAQSLAVASA